MSRQWPPRRVDRRRGLSMLEVIVSLTLVATILFVSLNASASIMRNRVAATRGVQAEILAGYFLDEISTLSFRDASDNAVFGLEPDESASDRTTYDDVDDYDGFREDSPTFRDGQTIDGYENWTVRGNVVPLALAGGTLEVSTDESSQFRLFGVRVTDPDGVSKTYRALLSITPSDHSPSQSHERLRRVEVRFSDDRVLDVVVPLRNMPEPTY